MKKTVISLLILSIIIFTGFSQPNPRIAVIPLDAVGISENETIIASELFETALVQTETFDVIEQNQITEILDAQSYSLSGCTDDTCAVEIGKLLSAEQIVLGTFSTLGSGFIINVKIINVTLGRNIRADKVSFSSMDDLPESVDLLAHKLAGLVYQSGGKVAIAEKFGELFISTNPPGADIYVNGIKKGTSPDLFTRIPVGPINIEARTDCLYASAEVNIESGTSEVTLELREIYGNLFIKSSEADVEVYLDDRKLGPLGDGFFRDIPAGEYAVSLMGEDVLWEDVISIVDGESTRIEAWPRAFGTINYNFPEGVEANITNTTYHQTVTGEGELKIWAGNYKVRITGEIYREQDMEISVDQGAMLELSPELELTPEGTAVQKNKIYSMYLARIENHEEEFKHISETEIDTFLSIITTFKDEMAAGNHSFPDLEERTDKLFTGIHEYKEEQMIISELKILKEDLSVLEEQYDAWQTVYKKRSRLKYIFGGLALGSLGGCGAGWYFENEAFSGYENAVSTSEAVDFREQSEMFNVVKLSAGAAGLGFAVLSAINWFSGDDETELKERMDTVSSRITELESQL